MRKKGKGRKERKEKEEKKERKRKKDMERPGERKGRFLISIFR